VIGVGGMTKIRRVLLLGLGLLGALVLWAPVRGLETDSYQLAAWWSFENPARGMVRDSASNLEDPLNGNFTVVEGVSGQAIRFDGFTTVIERDFQRAPRLEGDFTLEAWVAIAAYPWNWCPIIAQERGEDAGYYFGIGPQGHLGLKLSVGGLWVECLSEGVLPLRKWTHVAAVFIEGQGPRVYVDGRSTGRVGMAGGFLPAPRTDLRIGMNRDEVLPAQAVPPGAGTLPSWYSLDGILDELRIHTSGLGAREINNLAGSVMPDEEPDIPPRVMPSGPPGPGRFGAYYTHLNYYKEWDALWRVADHPDIVVQFDGSPVRVVFWRGLRYSPAWVTETGLWLADQSGESGNDEGCVEHMQDIHCLYSHVRILENTPARVVVHWRYAPVSSRNNVWTAQKRTGWAWWMDEYYTFYPDGTGVRKLRWRSPERGCEFPWLQIQETSVLCHPGQNAEDVLEHDALTLLNLEGNTQKYSWPDDVSVSTRLRRNMNPDPSIIRDLGLEHPVIQVVNMRAKAKPFVILEPGNRPLVYVGRLRPKLVDFPAYNHWPVCQVNSDGRFAQAADRASSFSISYNTPTRHEEPGGTVWAAMLYGATFEDPAGLVPLARSWVFPPGLDIIRGPVKALGYDLAQRAYLLKCTGSTEKTNLELGFQANSESPFVNACLILKDWGSGGVDVSRAGRPLSRGQDFLSGTIRTLEGTDLLLWINYTSESPFRLTIHERGFE
jgi:hypothetical protein